jgi:hypothetical protein
MVNANVSVCKTDADGSDILKAVLRLRSYPKIHVFTHWALGFTKNYKEN